MSSHGFVPAEQANNTAIPLIKDIFGVSADFLGQLKTWFEQNPPAIPVSQIVGFNEFTVQVAPTISTQEGTVSTTYTDLATVGPQLTGLSNGSYAIFFGCTSTWGASGSDQYMSVQVDSTAATDADAAIMGTITPGPTGVSIMRLVVKTLSGSVSGGHTLTAKYHGTGGGQPLFSNRWLIALRYANA